MPSGLHEDLGGLCDSNRYGYSPGIPRTPRKVAHGSLCGLSMTLMNVVSVTTV